MKIHELRKNTPHATQDCLGGAGNLNRPGLRPMARENKFPSVSVVLALAIVMVLGSAASQRAYGQEQTLADIFEPITVELGQLNFQRGVITDGPKAVKMKQGGKPGKQWNVSLGISNFLVTIEDGAKITIKDAIALAEKMPVRYRRALIIASGNEVDDDALKERRLVIKEAIQKAADAAKADKEGLAFYASVKSTKCTGDSMTLPAGTTPELLARAAGLLLVSHLQKTEADLFDRWAKAAKADGIPVSKTVGHAKNPKADIVEFAGLYAHTIDHLMGRGQHGQIQQVSPERSKLWQHILQKTGTKRLYLAIEFYPLGGELRAGFGNRNGDKAKITSGPTPGATKLFNRRLRKVVETPVKTYEGIIGDTKFKVSIEDVEMDLGLDDAKRLIESLPTPMRGGLTAISEEGEFGLALYKGGVAYGIPNRIAMGGKRELLSEKTFAHECGHAIDQLTNRRDANLRSHWGTARMIDDVRVSGYGDGPIHEDQACFASVYAIAYAYDNTAEKDRFSTKHKLDCPIISKTGYLNFLRKQAPARFALFEQMLVITDGMKEKDKAPSPDIDLDAAKEKMLACQKKMSPAIKKVQETVKGIVNAKMEAKAKK